MARAAQVRFALLHPDSRQEEPWPSAFEHTAALHRRLEDERVRHSSFASELRSFARHMPLGESAPHDDDDDDDERGGGGGDGGGAGGRGWSVRRRRGRGARSPAADWRGEAAIERIRVRAAQAALAEAAASPSRAPAPYQGGPLVAGFDPATPLRRPTAQEMASHYDLWRLRRA